MNKRRWLILGALARLMILATVFFLAAGVGAVAITVYERGLPFTGGSSPQQLQAPPASEDSEQADGAAASETSEAEDTTGGEPRDGRPIGVWYITDNQRWAIFNEDFSDMPEGATFDVYVLPEGESAFVHDATAGNISGDSTYVDNPLTNGNPDAAPQVTQNWNPGGSGEGTYNGHRVGIRYDEEAEMWAIFNEDGAEMPEGAAFNVGVFPPREPDLVHTATAANISGNWTYLDDPLINGYPATALFIVQK